MTTEERPKDRLNEHVNKGTKKRIGLLGGTFDPIHLTHLHMAEKAKRERNLDEIWFMPAKIPPHKQEQTITAEQDRIQMVQLAIEDVPYFQLCLKEFERKGPSYTIDTIKALKQDYQQSQFFFIIGADMVEYLPHWHSVNELVNMVQFIGIGRPGWDLQVKHQYISHVQPLEMIPSHLSSTAIREQIHQRKSVRFLLPEKVYQYIEEKRLYVDG